MNSMLETLPPVSPDDAYRTDPLSRVGVLSRILGALRVPFLFYPTMVRVVITASRRASRGDYHDAEWVASSLASIRALEEAGCRLEIEGLDRVRAAAGPVVFVANHMSTVETFALPALIQPLKPVTFVVKASLMTARIFGPVMRSRNPIAVGRFNPREDYATVMKEGTVRLGGGISVIVFPQTSRSTVFEPAEFNSLGVKLARRAGVPVLPVALKTDAWENGRRLKDLGHLVPSRTIRFWFGETIPIRGTGAAEQAELVRIISGKLAEWGAEVRGGSAADSTGEIGISDDMAESQWKGVAS